MSKRPVILEIRLPKGQLPSDKMNEWVINKFLKVCSKDGVMKEIYEKSVYTKRFEKPSVTERKQRMQYRRNAQKANKEQLSDKPSGKKRKSPTRRQD